MNCEIFLYQVVYIPFGIILPKINLNILKAHG